MGSVTRGIGCLPQRNALSTRIIIIILIISTIQFNNYTQSVNDQALSMKFSLYTTSDWTRVELTGTGDVKLLESSIIPCEYYSNIIVEEDYISIWVGKPQYDNTLTEVTLQIVAVNPSDIMINISKGYIGFSSLTLSCWGDEYHEVARITHTNTLGDPSHNRFKTNIGATKYAHYGISLAAQFNKQEKHVLAIYYPWYGAPDSRGVGRHWGNASGDMIENSTHYPLLGAYDSLNTSIISEHIKTASMHGITGFAVSWWGKGSYEDKALRKILETAGLKTCVYYESNRDGPPRSPEMVASELNYIIENYGYHENYLRYMGKPVVMVFDADGQGRDSEFWTEVRSRIWDCALVGDFREEELLDVFDGVHIYNELDLDEHRKITSWIEDQNKRLPSGSISGFNAQSSGGLINYVDKLNVGTVSPGYDDNKIRVNGTRLPRMGVETYRRYWENIHESDVDWVLITSWNEWHEGTEIEQSVEYGYDALNETSLQVKRFMETQR